MTYKEDFLQLGQFLLVSVERNMRKESPGWLFFVVKKCLLLGKYFRGW